MGFPSYSQFIDIIEEVNIMLLKHWEKPGVYHMDWDINNNNHYNLIMMPEKIITSIHQRGPQNAEHSGLKVGPTGNYDAVRNSLQNILIPYGTPEDYEEYYLK